MPSVFGLINRPLQPIRHDVICRMKDSAVYMKPRELVEQEINGSFFGSAITEKGYKSIAMEGDWLVVADASLYKRNELADKQGIILNRMSSDTELILQSWKKWGKTCIEHFYGDFAFVIFNTVTGEIFCGRDHMGVKPFFYSFIDDTFIYASELRIVLAALSVRPLACSDYLLDSLVTKKTNKNESPFDDIKRLSPAHSLHISEGQMVLREYWHLDPKRRIKYNSEAEYKNLLREKLVKAVEARCVGTQIGAELSGGLDSSAITGIASNILRNEGRILSTYSNVFPKGTQMDVEDERQPIVEMVKFTCVQWKEVDHLNRSIPELLQYATGVQGCYIQQNFSMLCDALYKTAGEDHISVLLSGFGGDEIVSARANVQWNELIREKEWKVLKAELFYKGFTLKSLLKAGIISLRYVYTFFKSAGKTSGVFTKKLLDGRFQNIPLQHDFSSKHLLRQRLADQYIRDKRSTLAMRQYDRIMHDHVPQRMEYCYAAAAQYGIEYRYPLLDVDLLETFLAFPSWMKQHLGINRYAFRQAILGYVPETIRSRNDKSGSTIPQTFYSMSMEREEILDVIHKASGSPFLKEIFDFEKFELWYEKIAHHNAKDNLMPGAFYTYLMILLYYKDTWK